MQKEYVRLVKIIRSAELPEELHKKALHDLVHLYNFHQKSNMPEARKYSKSALLYLFKEGRLRGLTEDLKGLKPAYIDIMDQVKASDMDFFNFTPNDRQCFSTLKDKLEHGLAFIISSNEHKRGILHEKVNHISSEGLNDEVYGLK